MRPFTADALALRLFDEAHEGVALFDASGALVGWNPAARAITGWDETAASAQDLLARRPGLLKLREGAWVDLRRSAVAADGGELHVVLLADASARVALGDAVRQLSEDPFVDSVSRLAGPRVAAGHLERSVALARRDERAVGVVAIGVEVPRIAEPVPVDELMAQLGKRVNAATRASDLAARTRDDEILIVLTAMAHASDIAIVAVRLLLGLSRPYLLHGRERSATISIGVATFPHDGDSDLAVADAARAAMHRVRADGGGYRAASAEVKERVPAS